MSDARGLLLASWRAARRGLGTNAAALAGGALEAAGGDVEAAIEMLGRVREYLAQVEADEAMGRTGTDGG